MFKRGGRISQRGQFFRWGVKPQHQCKMMYWATVVFIDFYLYCSEKNLTSSSSKRKLYSFEGDYCVSVFAACSSFSGNSQDNLSFLVLRVGNRTGSINDSWAIFIKREAHVKRAGE